MNPNRIGGNDSVYHNQPSRYCTLGSSRFHSLFFVDRFPTAWAKSVSNQPFTFFVPDASHQILVVTKWAYHFSPSERGFIRVSSSASCFPSRYPIFHPVRNVSQISSGISPISVSLLQTLVVLLVAVFLPVLLAEGLPQVDDPDGVPTISGCAVIGVHFNPILGRERVYE